MPTPVAAARQCLSPAAVPALDAAVASARRRAPPGWPAAAAHRRPSRAWRKEDEKGAEPPTSGPHAPLSPLLTDSLRVYGHWKTVVTINATVF
uniref:Uncharacterized protein n=1 Tax=Oryza punctata TaxID=4537 RepID=A0A0E0MIM9_ORYPU